MTETYTVVVSSEEAFTDEDLDATVTSLPGVIGWHRSALCPRGTAYLVAESRLQHRMEEVLRLYE